MERHSLEITQTAEKQLKKLSTEDQRRIVKAIVAPADHPRPRGSRKLTGCDDIFRSRVGQYRVLYTVSEKKLVILLLKIGHRKDVCR